MSNTTFWDALEELKEQDEKSRNFVEVSEMISDIIFGLSEARLKAGMTQKELAEACGMRQSAIARIEAGQNMPRLDTLAKIAGCLGQKVKMINAKHETISINEIRTKSGGASSLYIWNSCASTSITTAKYKSDELGVGAYEGVG